MAAELQDKSVTALREMISPKLKVHCGNSTVEIKKFLHAWTGKEFVCRLTKQELIKVLVMLMQWEKEREHAEEKEPSETVEPGQNEKKGIEKPKGEMTVVEERGVTIQEESFLPEETGEKNDSPDQELKPLDLTGQSLVRIKNEICNQLGRHYSSMENIQKYLDDWTFGINVSDMSEEQAIRVYKGVFADMARMDREQAKHVEEE